MKKPELRKYLKIYSKIRTDLLRSSKYSVITFYNRKRKIILPCWLLKVEKYLNMIASNADVITNQIIYQSYFCGIKDINLTLEIPVSLASIYRIKNKIEEVLFEFLILDGLVSRNDILNNFD